MPSQVEMEVVVRVVPDNSTATAQFKFPSKKRNDEIGQTSKKKKSPSQN